MVLGKIVAKLTQAPFSNAISITPVLHAAAGD